MFTIYPLGSMFIRRTCTRRKYDVCRYSVTGSLLFREPPKKFYRTSNCCNSNLLLHYNTAHYSTALSCLYPTKPPHRKVHAPLSPLTTYLSLHLPTLIPFPMQPKAGPWFWGSKDRPTNVESAFSSTIHHPNIRTKY